MRAFVAALIALSLSVAHAADFTLVVDRSTEMPWAAFRDGVPVDGIHRDIGAALAERLGRTARFVVLPRRRVPRALESGEADAVCVLLPAWLPGPFQWTEPFVDNADVVLTARSVPAPADIAALAGEPVGTINGFAYPALEQALGAAFVRDDAPDARTNLRKLELGHLKHVVTNQRYLEYQLRRQPLAVPVYVPLLVSRQQLGCAISPRAPFVLADVNRAIADLVRSGALQRILAKYR
ncbi:MAG: transporter substrate-binding domain-containing protein [Pelomonas sp.]|nr:transporter substrate-binding domain-containing protein [Roseateles sp.]